MTSCENCGRPVEQPFAISHPQQMTRQVFCSPSCRRTAMATEAMEHNRDPLDF